MALIKCPECGREVSDKAISCPNCGYVLNSKNGKQSKKVNKTTIFVVITLLILILVLGITLWLKFESSSKSGDGLESMIQSSVEQPIEQFSTPDLQLFEVKGRVKEIFYEKEDLRTWFGDTIRFTADGEWSNYNNGGLYICRYNVSIIKNDKGQLTHLDCNNDGSVWEWDYYWNKDTLTGMKFNEGDLERTITFDYKDGLLDRINYIDEDYAGTSKYMCKLMKVTYDSQNNWVERIWAMSWYYEEGVYEEIETRRITYWD